jgi:hypothetical protein
MRNRSITVRRALIAGAAALTLTFAGGVAAPAYAGSTGAAGASAVLSLPDVRGVKQFSATQQLQTLGLNVTTYTVTVWDSSDGGRVMGQIPAAGTQVQTGSTVQLAIGLWGGGNR